MYMISARAIVVASLALVGVLAAVRTAGATPVSFYTASDGAKYHLDATNVGAVYTFTFTADFAGVTTSDALGDYAMLISFKSQSNAEWTLGSLLNAPGTESSWRIVQNDSNSNGCKPGASGSEWCIELNHTAGALTGPVIATGTVLTWQHTMTLQSGTPDFSVNWPFKFTTTTGAFDSGSADWVYGGYQISQELASCTTTPCTTQQITSAPEPATIFLFGSGLIAVAAGLRRRHLDRSM